MFTVETFTREKLLCIENDESSPDSSSYLDEFDSKRHFTPLLTYSSDISAFTVCILKLLAQRISDNRNVSDISSNNSKIVLNYYY